MRMRRCALLVAIAACGGGSDEVCHPPGGAGPGIDLDGPMCKHLSSYRLFDDVSGQVADPALFAYDLNTPLFSDYAEKRRYIYLPPGARITYRTTGVMEFPIGAALVKTFAYPADFRRPQDQEVVPLQFPPSLLRRELRFPVRATPFYGTARTHINKSPASQRARGVGETHCSTEIHIPISLRVIGVSNSGKMDHEVERETYFWKSERVSLKIKPNRTHLRIGNIEGAMMDRGPKPTVILVWQQGAKNTLAQGRRCPRKKHGHS